MALIRHTVTDLRFKCTRAGPEGARTVSLVISYTEGADDHEWVMDGLAYEKLIQLMTYAKIELYDTDTPGVAAHTDMDMTVQDS